MRLSARLFSVPKRGQVNILQAEVGGFHNAVWRVVVHGVRVGKGGPFGSGKGAKNPSWEFEA